MHDNYLPFVAGLYCGFGLGGAFVGVIGEFAEKGFVERVFKRAIVVSGLALAFVALRYA